MELGTILWILIIGILLGIALVVLIIFLYLTSPFRKLLIIRTLVGEIGDIAHALTSGFSAINSGISSIGKGIVGIKKLRKSKKNKKRKVKKRRR